LFYKTTQNNKEVNAINKRVATTLKVCILIGILYFSFLQFKIIQYANTTIPKNADYIIILGTKVNGTKPSLTLKNRIDTAVNYLKKNRETIAIASGGKGPNEGISEAIAIKQGLITKGIGEGRIILEDQSSRTTENIAFSKKLVPDEKETGIVVSNYFHIYRARSIAKDNGLSLYALPAKTPIKEAPKWYFREYLAITKYYLEKTHIIN